MSAKMLGANLRPHQQRGGFLTPTRKGRYDATREVKEAATRVLERRNGANVPNQFGDLRGGFSR
jgi:hypothetical protein